MKHFNELINSGENLFVLKNLDLFNKDIDSTMIEDRIDSITHDEASVKAAFDYAFKEKKKEYALALYNHHETKKYYDFLGDQRARLLESLGIFKLPPLLCLSYQESFDDILKHILELEDVSAYRRRFRKGIISYGTVFLNNLIILKKMIDIKENFDEILSLDHHKEISSDFLSFEPDRSGQFDIEILKNIFSVKQTWRLLSQVPVESGFFSPSSHDIPRLLQTILAFNSNADTPVSLSEIIGRKARTFFVIHDRLSRFLEKKNGIERQRLYQVELNQDITFLEGKKVDEFTIFVPKTVGDLLELGARLSICVGSYYDSVIEKENQIIALMILDEPKYCIELAQEPTGEYGIIQFKGARNFDSMEGEKGRQYRDLILKWLNNHEL